LRREETHVVVFAHVVASVGNFLGVGEGNDFADFGIFKALECAFGVEHVYVKANGVLFAFQKFELSGFRICPKGDLPSANDVFLFRLRQDNILRRRGG
jgi:hypothetical protein